MAFIRRDSHFHTYYRLCGDRYGAPTILALEGVTPLAAVPGAIIHWDPIVARIRKSQND
jgi:hypothetical protein